MKLYRNGNEVDNFKSKKEAEAYITETVQKEAEGAVSGQPSDMYLNREQAVANYTDTLRKEFSYDAPEPVGTQGSPAGGQDPEADPNGGEAPNVNS